MQAPINSYSCTERASPAGLATLRRTRSYAISYVLSCSVYSHAAYLFRGERVLHKIQADRAHEFATESAWRDSDHGRVRHHLVGLAVQLVETQFCGREKEGVEGGKEGGIGL